MNYQSPVDLIISEMNMRMDGEIFKAVQNVGVNVDRDELIKALRYDRDQYKKGYADRDEEIVRCKDCKHGEQLFAYISCQISEKNKSGYHVSHKPDWFCADGKRKEERKMVDIDKTIKCLDACIGSDDCAGQTCPYWDYEGDVGCRTQMEMDALELLKKYRAKE